MYDAWGKVKKLIVNDVDQPLRLQGQYFDRETGLHYNRFRYYCAEIGAFVSQDPLKLAAGENIYLYAPNVQKWIDPLGLCKKGINSSSRYLKEGYQSGTRSNNLFAKDKFTKKTEQLTEWRRSIDKTNIGNERRLFLGEDYVKIGEGKWRSLDGTRQFRVKPDDYLGGHGIGMPTIPNIPHVHFEFLQPKGNSFEIIKNIHVPLK